MDYWKKHNVCSGQKLQWWKQHFWKVYLVQLHFVEILHRRYWMGKHWEQGAFCTGPVDVWVWSPALPGAQKATGTDPLGLPSYTSLQGQADSGLLPGSTKNKIKSVTLKLQLNFGIQTKNISNTIHMSKRVWSSIQFLYVHVHLHALPTLHCTRTCLQPSTTGIIHSGSVACVLSSIRTDLNCILANLGSPVPTQVQQITSAC